MPRATPAFRRTLASVAQTAFIIMVAAGWPAVGRTEPAREAYSTKRAAIASLCTRFSGYDPNLDGRVEIEKLVLTDMGARAEEGAAERDAVLVIVEPRLLRTGDERGALPELQPSLRGYATDLAAEGHDSFVLTASVYAGERHQDGRTVLALREFLRGVWRRVPGLRGVVLVGNYPEAMVVRQYYWLKRTPITLNEGKPNQEKFEKDVDYVRDKAELVAWRSDLVLSDLDGRWEQVYHEEREELPCFIAVLPEGAQAADGVSSHLEFGTDAFEDFFFVHDGKWAMEAMGEGRIRFRQLPDENDECAPDDLALPNPLARPDIIVSRLNAYHAALEPKQDIVDATGKHLLDSKGLPQTLTFADAQSAPRAISVWTHSEQTERQLLVEYFARNHRYRTGGYPAAHKPACFSTDFGSSLPEARKAFPEWKDFDEPGYDVEGEAATLLECLRWLKRPAALRFLKAHSDPWGSSVRKTDDAAALTQAIGDTPRGWRNEGNQLVPGFLNQDKVHFEYYRALWANKQLPDCAAFYLHTGCESIAPEGAGTLSYSSPRYGYWQGAESLMFYCNGLALVGRSKVFYDEPREFVETLAQGRTWGDAWARYFTVESSATNVDDVGGGIGRKRAYFWSVLGDWTLTLGSSATR